MRLTCYFCVLTEESAEQEPAWQGAGQEPGLKIWRIEVSSFKKKNPMLFTVVPNGNFPMRNSGHLF